jgi:hypothetical protein
MKTGLKRFIKYYFLYALTFVGVFFNKLNDFYILILVLPLILLLISQFIGFLINHFVEKDSLKTKIFNKSYLFLFSAIFLVCLFFKISVWYQNEFRKNINANLKFTSEYLDSDFEFLAFESLNKLIEDQNSFKLNAIYNQVYDTIISGRKKKYNFVEFHYFNENTKSNNKAKFVNINGVPLNVYFNKNLSRNEHLKSDSLINVTNSYFREIKKFFLTQSKMISQTHYIL